MNSNITSGQCFCGQVRFNLKGEPLWVSYCHCNSCRRSTGAPVTTFVGFKKTQVKFIKGERKIHASSPGVRRGFCSACGTPMTYEADHCETEIHLYISLMNHPDVLIPQRHVFYDEHVSWLSIDDNLPRFSGASDAGSPGTR